jgi:hypothetical protein
MGNAPEIGKASVGSPVGWRARQRGSDMDPTGLQMNLLISFVKQAFCGASILAYRDPSQLDDFLIIARN